MNPSIAHSAHGQTPASGHRIAGEKVVRSNQSAHVTGNPGAAHAEASVRVRQVSPQLTTLEITCLCGEIIEVQLQHPAEGRNSAD